MAGLNQLGKAVSITAGGFTTTDILEYNFTLDIEAHEHFGAGAFPHKTAGNATCTLEIKTKDKNFAKNYVKTMDVADIELTVNAASKGATVTAGVLGFGTLTQETYGFTSGYVSEPVSYTASSDGVGAEFTITFKACVDSTDGTDPDVTVGGSVTP